MAEFTKEEIKHVVFQMGAWKAPGPDGFPTAFYQAHWATIEGEVTREILNILNGSSIPEGMNDTLLVLIPKVRNLTELTQFRPISLCNVAYKIVSKVLTNRLKQILPALVTQEQSAFVGGRLITDNILTAYECLHTIKRRRKGNRGLCAVKLDMPKAYDRIEWNFLQQILVKFGFNNSWMNLMMKCVTSTRFSVIVNGARTETFTPTRGLRQGDPLSPYLFLLCAEGLSHMLQKIANSSQRFGMQVCRGAPKVSHLLFADDSAVFLRATMKDAQNLNRVLTDYCKASGQRINYEKSSVFFSTNTPTRIREAIKTTLHVSSEALTEKYLGLPTAVGSNKNESFRLIIDRVQKRLAGWKEHLLSQGGKEVLLKSVVQAIPTYSMQCFKLTTNLCRKLATAANRFWWGSNDHHQKIHWRAWDKMALPKGMGGMGFRDFETFNRALLAKQAWRLLQNPDSLCARILKARYFPNTTFLEAQIGRSPSHTWRSILHGREALKSGLIWRVGSGQNVRIWEDRWQPRLLKPIRSEAALLENHHINYVADLMDHTTKRWRKELVESVFEEDDASLILKTPLSRYYSQDILAWEFEHNGIFSVRSLYRHMAESEQAQGLLTADASLTQQKVQQLWKTVWKISVPSKINVFIWRLGSALLPTTVQLKERGMQVDVTCFKCREAPETTVHAIWGCKNSKLVWDGIQDKFNILFLLNENQSAMRILSTNLIGKAITHKRLFAITCWQLWGERNKIHLGQQPRTPHEIVTSIAHILEECSVLDAKKQNRRIGAGVKAHPKWKEPPLNWVKVNTDVAISSKNNKVGLGVIIRNSNGRCIASCAKPIPCSLAPLMGEAMALLEGLTLAREKCFTKC